jgi:DNA-binding IscR family transcriptional regulator
MDFDNNFAFITAALHCALSLNSQPALAVLVTLALEADDDRRCSPSYENIASRTGIKSTVTISRAIKLLMGKGILTRVRGRAGSVTYAIHLDAIAGLESEGVR